MTMKPALLLCNTTPYTFRGWVPFTVPIKAPAPPFDFLDRYGNVQQVILGQPFCRSARYAYVHAELGPTEETVWTSIDDADRAVPEFKFPPINITVTIDGAAHNVSVDMVPDGPVQRGRARWRNGDQVVELWLEQHEDGVIFWELLAVASNPTRSNLQLSLGDVRLSCGGGMFAVSHNVWRDPAHYEGEAELVLYNETNRLVGDSQGLAFSGAFVPNRLDAASFTSDRPWAVCTAWDGRFGPFNSPTQMTNGAYSQARRDALNWLRRTPTYDLWSVPPLGLAANANQTGGQNDFGALKGLGCFATAAYLPMVYRSAMQEACRPGHFREANGTPVSHVDHPNHVTWNHHTHYHPSVSSDRLGKMLGDPRFTAGYFGPDREHWSANTLVAAIQLTGSPMLQRILESTGYLILAGETLDPRLSTSHTGAPRGVGRTLQTAKGCWIAMSINDESAGTFAAVVRERIGARIDLVARETANSRNQAYGQCLGTIEDNRAMGALVPAVGVWQEAIGLLGLGAWMDNEVAAALFVRCAESWLTHGWRIISGTNRWEMADYVEFANPSNWVRREGFEEWAGATLRLCAIHLTGPMNARARLILEQYQPETLDQHEWLAAPLPAPVLSMDEPSFIDGSVV